MGIDLYNLVISAKLQKGGGGDIDVDSLTVTENGTYSASSGHAFDPVVVSVPTGVFPSGTKDIASNGIYDVESFKSASVNVPQPSGTSSITANGIYDITSFASVDVNVSGGGGDHDAEDGIIARTISEYTNSRVSAIGSYAFHTCVTLGAASFPNVSSIGSNAFNNCNSLMSFYLLSTSVAQLVAPNAFTNTPMSKSSFTGSYGSIYVPASLVDSYKNASNWALFSARITSYVE